MKSCLVLRHHYSVEDNEQLIEIHWGTGRMLDLVSFFKKIEKYKLVRQGELKEQCNDITLWLIRFYLFLSGEMQKK